MFRPTADRSILRLRARLLKQIRNFFDSRGFLEVETPILSADCVVDRHLDPFSVQIAADRVVWLQTSPEFAMKRLLAAGETAIYQVTHAFRQEESGPLHNPEFTMVEWYRVGDSIAAGIDLLDQLSQTIFGRGQARRLSYGDAFKEYVGLDPHRDPTERFIEQAQKKKIAYPESLSPDDRDSWLDLLLSQLVQPNLGKERPTILFDYPASQAALARLRRQKTDNSDETVVAERFELYLDGVELANGYHELTEPEELRSRNREANRLRIEDGKEPIPEQSRLLEAMEAGLPGCSGVALGFDRAVMVAAGVDSIDQVIPFPFERA
jgi:elongation factor P--(R)-beta-lysine ligase